MRKSAFTLAEVLVTLGIIGIVAAMTLPMLAKNYQQYVLLQQFKKAYATIAIASQKTQIDMGEGVKCFYYKNKYGYDAHGVGNWTDCDYFFSEFVKNLKISKICEGDALEGKCIPKDMRGGEKVYAEVQGGDDKQAAEEQFERGCKGFMTNSIQNFSQVYVVNSGFTIIRYNTGAVRGYAPLFVVDVNAHKGPNKWGYDIYVLEFDKSTKKDSVFNVIGASHCAPLDYGGVYAKDVITYLYPHASL
ncbi:type II secretion system protein [bacterium]|nr:type II secretion system protein [bacterium]